MNKLREFLNSLSSTEQSQFATNCGTTIASLRTAISKKSKLGAALCMKIEIQSAQKVTRLDLLSMTDCLAIWPNEFNRSEFEINQ
ncbi:MAG: hypothetical protein ACK5MF_00385 [Vibrio sp.]|uniref:hypothetical protein n=1 Tax=Vibrio sp. TaxID=678 RepID=UPI003A861CD1